MEAEALVAPWQEPLRGHLAQRRGDGVLGSPHGGEPLWQDEPKLGLERVDGVLAGRAVGRRAQIHDSRVVSQGADGLYRAAQADSPGRAVTKEVLELGKVMGLPAGLWALQA